MGDAEVWGLVVVAVPHSPLLGGGPRLGRGGWLLLSTLPTNSPVYRCVSVVSSTPPFTASKAAVN